MKNSINVIIAAILVLVYMIGLGVLAWHGTITGDQALAAVGVILLPLVGALAHLSGVNAGGNAMTMPYKVGLSVDGREVAKQMGIAEGPKQ